MSPAITSPADTKTEIETLSRDIETTGETLVQTRKAIGQVIFGQEHVIEETLITLLAGGHGRGRNTKPA